MLDCRQYRISVAFGIAKKVGMILKLNCKLCVDNKIKKCYTYQVLKLPVAQLDSRDTAFRRAESGVLRGKR